MEIVGADLLIMHPMAPTQVLSFGFIDVKKNIDKQMSSNNYCISKKKKKVPLIF
jgi:hypothetical protein